MAAHCSWKAAGWREAQGSSDWGLEIVSHCHVAGEGGLITVSTHHHRRDWHQMIGNPLKPPAMTLSHHPWGTYCRECSYGGVMRRYQFICRSSGISYNDPSAGVEIVCFAAAIAEQILHFKADPACPGHLPASHSNLTLAIGKQLSLHSKLTK